MSADERLPNGQLRSARGHHRLTQAGLARAVNAETRHTGEIDGDYVSKLERGLIAWPGAEYRRAFRVVLGAGSDAELGFVCRRRHPTSEGGAMNRRDLLSATAALAFSPAIGIPAAEFLTRIVEEPAPARVGIVEARQVSHAANDASRWDNEFGGLLARATINSQVRWAVGLLSASIAPNTERELYGAVGRLSEVAGWMHHDAGSEDAARSYLDLSLYCAGHAHDDELRAVVLSDLARQHVYLGKPDDALDFIGMARAREHRLTPTLVGMVAGVQARAHARAGNEGEALRAVGVSEDAYSGAGPGNDPTWEAYPHSAQVWGDSGEALYDLARHGQQVDNAMRRLRNGADTYPLDYARSRAFCLTHLAALQMQHGDPAEGTATGREALAVSSSLASRRQQQHLRDLSAAAGQSGAPAALDLQRDVDALLTA